jgi:hypothetical protein
VPPIREIAAYFICDGALHFALKVIHMLSKGSFWRSEEPDFEGTTFLGGRRGSASTRVAAVLIIPKRGRGRVSSGGRAALLLFALRALSHLIRAFRFRSVKQI